MSDWRIHNFWKNIPDDCKKAISELKRLKVFRLLGLDYEETFADVWWLVLHEVDLYEEGEFCYEASRNYMGEVEPSAMNLRQAIAADNWLVRWLPLFNKYKEDECHSELWLSMNSSYCDKGEQFFYSGQIA